MITSSQVPAFARAELNYINPSNIPSNDNRRWREAVRTDDFVRTDTVRRHIHLRVTGDWSVLILDNPLGVQRRRAREFAWNPKWVDASKLGCKRQDRGVFLWMQIRQVGAGERLQKLFVDPLLLDASWTHTCLEVPAGFR